MVFVEIYAEEGLGPFTVLNPKGREVELDYALHTTGNGKGSVREKWVEAICSQHAIDSFWVTRWQETYTQIALFLSAIASLIAASGLLIKLP